MPVHGNECRAMSLKKHRNSFNKTKRGKSFNSMNEIGCADRYLQRLGVALAEDSFNKF